MILEPKPFTKITGSNTVDIFKCGGKFSRIFVSTPCCDIFDAQLVISQHLHCPLHDRLTRISVQRRSVQAFKGNA